VPPVRAIVMDTGTGVPLKKAVDVADVNWKVTFSFGLTTLTVWLAGATTGADALVSVTVQLVPATAVPAPSVTVELGVVESLGKLTVEGFTMQLPVVTASVPEMAPLVPLNRWTAKVVDPVETGMLAAVPARLSERVPGDDPPEQVKVKSPAALPAMLL